MHNQERSIFFLGTWENVHSAVKIIEDLGIKWYMTSQDNTNMDDNYVIVRSKDVDRLFESLSASGMILDCGILPEKR